MTLQEWDWVAIDRALALALGAGVSFIISFYLTRSSDSAWRLLRGGVIQAGILVTVSLTVFIALFWPNTVTVPRLSHVTKDQAEIILIGRGLVPRAIERTLKGLAAEHLLAGTQRPAAGQRVRPGTVVSFIVSAPARSRAPRLIVISRVPPPAHHYVAARRRPPVSPPMHAARSVVVEMTTRPPVASPWMVSGTTIPPVFKRVSVSLTRPLPGSHIYCRSQDCVIAVSGTSRGVTAQSDFRLLLWWKAAGGSWILQPVGITSVGRNGDWHGLAHIDRVGYRLHSGVSLALGVSLTDFATANHLTQVGGLMPVIQSHLQGFQSASVSGLVIAMR